LQLKEQESLNAVVQLFEREIVENEMGRKLKLEHKSKIFRFCLRFIRKVYKSQLKVSLDTKIIRVKLL